MNNIQNYNKATYKSERSVAFAGNTNSDNRITNISECPIQINDTKHQHKKTSLGAAFLGLLTGYGIYLLTCLQMKCPVKFIVQPLYGKITSTSDKDLAHIDQTAEKILEKTGLTAKGYKIIKVKPEDVNKITNSFLNPANNKNMNPKTKICGKHEINSEQNYLKKLSIDFKKYIFQRKISKIADGKLASCSPGHRTILIPAKGRNLTVFHEIGHALNTHPNTINKLLKQSHKLSLLRLPIILTALCKNKKAPEEQPKGCLDKATTFIKNNAGKLVFATFIPLLFEEGLASIRGYQQAKKYLKPELAKKLPPAYALAFSTYLAGAIISGLGIHLGVKVRDAVVSKIQQQKIQNNTNKINCA